MNKIELNFYDDSVARLQTENEEAERIFFKNFLLEHAEATKTMNEIFQQVKILNEDRKQWFENLAGSAIEFARDCVLNLRMWIDDDLHGRIEFETAYLALDQLSDPLMKKFFTYLVTEADSFETSLSLDLFQMEFSFDLFDLNDDGCG